MKTKKFIIPAVALAALTAVYGFAQPPRNVVDEVAWIVGDQAIFRSDVEEMYQQLRSEGLVIQEILTVCFGEDCS